MSQGSSIEWTEATWNPVAGCTPVSPGCLHCYAAKMSHRLEGMGQEKYRGLTVLRNGVRTFNGKINLDHDALLSPLNRKKPTMYFVNSMSDLFHENVPSYFIHMVLFVVQKCSQHTFQVLTKRPDRMAHEMDRWVNGCGHAVMPNLWLGTSCERQQEADQRIPHLLRCPAAVRFISAEPLLGPIDLTRVQTRNSAHEYLIDAVGGLHGVSRGESVDWVIVGSESGSKRRPMITEWARGIERQCRAAGVAFFMKQMEVDGKVTGEIDTFPDDLKLRQFPTAETVTA